MDTRHWPLRRLFAHLAVSGWLGEALDRKIDQILQSFKHENSV